MIKILDKLRKQMSEQLGCFIDDVSYTTASLWLAKRINLLGLDEDANIKHFPDIIPK